MRTRVKICGVTRAEDAELACRLGADAVGVVFVSRSRRCATIEQGRAVRDAVGGLTPLVALFADQGAAEVDAVIDQVKPDLLQFHGGEDPAYCASFSRPWLKALSHREYAARRDAFAGARGLVVDSHAPGELGGTGESFDWSKLHGDSERSLLLAGGLTPENVAAAIRMVRPYGVDVASGVEKAPGVKDPGLLEEFFREVRSVDC